MPDLAALTAFGQSEPRRRRFGMVILGEAIGTGLVSLALRRDVSVPQVRGLQLPEPGAWVEDAAVAAFWTGPNQWMIEVKDGGEADLERELKDAGPDAAVTVQTDGWVVLEITSEEGPRPLDRILEKLVNLDPARLAPGSATRTGLDHMSVFVIRRSPTVVAVLGMRSMAGSLWHALETATARVADGGR